MLGAARVVRPANVVVSFVGTVVGALAAIALSASLPPARLLFIALAAASAALVTAGGNVLNDIEDLAGDRVNHPERPLVTGEITLVGARRLAVALFASGAVLAVPVAIVEPPVAAILAVAVAGLLLYELRFKALGLAGNLTVAGLTGLVFLYGGASVGAVGVVVPFAGMAFLATLSREVIKDMEDVRGDVDRTTLPKTLGLARTSWVARGAIVAAIALSLAPLVWLVSWRSVVGLGYLGLVGAADAIFVGSVIYLPDRLHFEQSVSKGAMAVALCAFLAVAFR